MGSSAGGAHMENISSEIIRKDVLRISSYRSERIGKSTMNVELPRMSVGALGTYNLDTGFFRRQDRLDFEDINRRFPIRELATYATVKFNETIVDDYISDPSIAIEFKRVMIALRLWEQTPGEKLYSKEIVFRDLLLEGPKYITRLKDEWEYGIRKSHHIPVMGRTFTQRPVKHYNALPVISHLINWFEEPEDYKLMADKVPLSKEYLESFKNELYQLLPDDIPIPPDAEIWSKTKTSMSYSQSEGKTIPFWKARLEPEGRRFSKAFRGYRCVVPIAAGNCRDAVVTPIDTYNSVNWCDRVILGILDELPESLISSSPSVGNRRLKTASTSQKGVYYLRDIKKCGMTFPRRLFHAVQDVLIEKYPDKDFSRFDIYRNFVVYKDNAPIPTNRGYCLGMANNLVTLCQIVCYRMLRSTLPSSIDTEYWCGNDDSLLLIRGYESVMEDLATVETTDDEIITGLGITKHDDKSFWSINPIIFEEYGNENFMSKDSRFAMALAPCFLVDDIKTSKRLCNSLSPLLSECKGENYKLIKQLAAHWGYDYFAEEGSYDYLLGGWVSKYSEGNSTILREISEASEEDIPLMFLAYRKTKAYESSLLPHYNEEGNGENYSHLGAALGIRFVKADIELPEFLRREALLLPKKEYERFYKKAFELSRRPSKAFDDAERRCRKIRGVTQIHKVEFMQRVCTDLDKPLAIPKQLVTLETYLWHESESQSISPFYYHNRVAGYLEKLRLENKIYAPPIHELSRSLSSILCEHPIPNNCEVKRYRLLENDELPEGASQFSRNPDIPLSEYVKKYGVLPSSIYRFKKDFDQIPDKVYKYRPRNEREAIFILDISDEALLDIAIEAVREERIQQEQSVEEVFEELVDACLVHPQNLVGGWDDSFTIFTVGNFNCPICQLHQNYFSYRIRKEHSDSPEERLSNEQLFEVCKGQIRLFVETHYPERIAEVAPLIEDNDIFDGSDDGLFGETSMFD